MNLFTTILAAAYATLALAHGPCQQDQLCTGLSHEACHFHCLTRGHAFGVCTIDEGCPATTSICACDDTSGTTKRDDDNKSALDTPTTDINGDGQLDDVDKILAILAEYPVIDGDGDGDDAETNGTRDGDLDKRGCHSVEACWKVAFVKVCGSVKVCN